MSEIITVGLDLAKNVFQAQECLRARGFDLDPTWGHHTSPRREHGRNRGRIHVSTR
ncbi:hypothetical protein SAMN04244548_01574 [Paracoccus pantotrophus]|nr:hypothetical protein SAMN04244548_01574 [Paracoccus pantotrophus]